MLVDHADEKVVGNVGQGIAGVHIYIQTAQTGQGFLVIAVASQMRQDQAVGSDLGKSVQDHINGTVVMIRGDRIIAGVGEHEKSMR